MLSNKNNKNIYVQYSLLFIAVATFVAVQFIAMNKTMVWSVDGYLQWYAMFAKFKSVFVNLFQGGGLALWQWDIGLGGDLISNFSLVLFDPFSYIALLFPTSMLDIAYSIIVVLKLYVAGLVVLSYLKYKNKSFNMCLIGAISYAFCAWGLASIRHDFFVTQLILFPLIIWGIDKVWKKENPAMLIVSIFFSSTISLYFTYMTAIVVFVYVVVKYFNEREEKTFKYFRKKAISIIGYSVVGALIACPVIGSMLYALVNTSTEAGTTMSLLPGLEDFLRYIPGFAGYIDVNTNYEYMALNGIVLVALPVVLLFKKKTTAMIMSIVVAVFAFFPIFQSILNGLSYPAGRWCYAIAFFFVVAGIESLELLLNKEFEIKKKFYIAFGVLGALLVVVAWYKKVILPSAIWTWIVNIVFAGLIIAIILQGQKKETALKWVVILNTAIFCFTVFSPFFGNDIEIYMDRGENYRAYESSSLSEASKIKDNDFYRVNTNWNPWPNENGPAAHTAVNTNIYFGVPSTFEYLSTLDSDWIKYNVELANSGGNFRRMTSLNNDNRCRIDFLQGAKYYLSSKVVKPYSSKEINYDEYKDAHYSKLENKELKVNTFKSDIETGLGYVFDNVVTESDYLKLDSVKREQLLMNSLVVKNEDSKELSNLKTKIDSSFLEKTRSIPYSLKKDSKRVVLKENVIKTREANGHVFIHPEVQVKDCELYVVFKGIKSNDDFAVYLSRKTNGGEKVLKGLVNASCENQGVQNVKDYIVNLGHIDELQKDIVCTFPQEGKYKYENIKLLVVPTTKYETNAKKLSKQRFKTTSIKNDEVTGTVDAKKNGMLYLSIIKNDGWDIYIDGEKADKVYQVDTAFTGVKISKGHHTVKLVYNIVWIKYTLIGMIIGIIAFVLIEIKRMLDRKRSKDRRRS